MKLRFILCVILISILAAFPMGGLAQDGITTIIGGELNLRSGDGTNFSVIATLAPQTSLIVLGRNNVGDWLFVRAGDLEGWVASRFVDVGGRENLRALPVRESTSAPPAADNTGINTTISSDGPVITDITLSAGVIQTARRIFRTGQSLGNLPNVIIKVGDSVSADREFGPTRYPFLCAFTDNNYELGEYGYLQDIITIFGGSFCQRTIAAQSGFAIPNIFDPTWNVGDLCDPNESPLDCDIRVRRPSVAIIYWGAGDMNSRSPSEFQEYLEDSIKILSERGVVPVLNTFSIGDPVLEAGDGRPAAFNAVIRNVAARYQVPLIDFANASLGLPNNGTIDDNYHLTARDDGHVSFSGGQFQYGQDLRNLLTLQVLYQLHVKAFN